MAVNLNVQHAESGGVRRWSRSSFEAAPSHQSSNAEEDEDELRQGPCMDSSI